MKPLELMPVLEQIAEYKLTDPLIMFGVGRDKSEIDAVVNFCTVNKIMVYFCDSFQGLPEPETEEDAYPYGTKEYSRRPSVTSSPGPPTYESGMYTCSLYEVNQHLLNVHGHDGLDTVFFVPGFFKDTLPKFAEAYPDRKYSGCIIDVDYISSLSCVLEYMKGRLHDVGIVACHEVTQSRIREEMARYYTLRYAPLPDEYGPMVRHALTFGAVDEAQAIPNPDNSEEILVVRRSCFYTHSKADCEMRK